MKTVTEFFGMNLKQAAEKVAKLREEALQTTLEAMKSEGKSEEEISAGHGVATQSVLETKIAEEFKIEGEKLSMFLAAQKIHADSRGNVKRIVVMAKSNDAETPPSNLKEVDGKFYLVELFPEPTRALKGKGDAPFGRGREGKGGRDGKKGKKREGRERRPSRRPDGAPMMAKGAEGAASGESAAPGFQPVPGAKKRRERKPRTPIEPYRGPNRIVLKGATPAANPAPTSTSSEGATESSEVGST